MNIADIYRAEILRAAFGPRYSELKAHDIAHLNRIAGILAEAEAAKEALQAKGYGRGGRTFIELTREVPDNSPALLAKMFAPRTPTHYPVPAQRRKP